MHTMELEWTGKLGFRAADEADHTVHMDLAVEQGGDDAGFRPMPLLLAALGGCMGVDVKLILDKKKLDVREMSLTVEGELDETRKPRTYRTITTTVRVRAEGLTQKALQQAIDLSEEKYCNVSAVLGQTAELRFVGVVL